MKTCNDVSETMGWAHRCPSINPKKHKGINHRMRACKKHTFDVGIQSSHNAFVINLHRILTGQKCENDPMQTRNVEGRIVRAFGGSQFSFCESFVKRVNARISCSIRSAEKKNTASLNNTHHAREEITFTCHSPPPVTNSPLLVYIPEDISETSSTQTTGAESSEEGIASTIELTQASNEESEQSSSNESCRSNEPGSSDEQGSSNEPTTVEPPTKRTRRSPLTVFQEKIDAVKTEKQYKKTLGELESNKRVTERSDFALAYLIKLCGYESVSDGDEELFRDVLDMITLVKARLMKHTKLTPESVLDEDSNGRTNCDAPMAAVEAESKLDCSVIQETILCLPANEYETSRRELSKLSGGKIALKTKYHLEKGMEIKEFEFESDEKDSENNEESEKSKLTAFQKLHGSKETKTVICCGAYLSLENCWELMWEKLRKVAAEKKVTDDMLLDRAFVMWSPDGAVCDNIDKK